ncbi:MAG: type II secretion system protein [Sulfuricella sp.]|jgi:general secretion pathway protein I|nr:type II secretion system protein [Sulfuricella sp.]
MRSACRGFSLLEVLVAFVILSLALSVLMQIFSGGTRNAALANDYSRAVLLAETKLAAAGIETPLQDGVVAGSTDERFHWQLAMRMLPAAADAPAALMPVGLFDVEARVMWEDGGKERMVKLDTMRIAPLNAP